MVMNDRYRPRKQSKRKTRHNITPCMCETFQSPMLTATSKKMPACTSFRGTSHSISTTAGLSTLPTLGAPCLAPLSLHRLQPRCADHEVEQWIVCPVPSSSLHDINGGFT
jgi:hypothetical protein